MIEDSQGFLYPKADESRCVDCGLCEMVCPCLKETEPSEVESVLAAKNPDDKVRLSSSSGGIFPMLAEKILSQTGVVFGVRFDENWETVHCQIDEPEQLALLTGSKYVQSRIEDNYEKAESLLKLGRKVLFSGTPCQIAGLKCYLRKDYDNLLTVEVVCHGVPSPSVWRDYLRYICPEAFSGEEKITAISFRDKTNGWKDYNVVVEAGGRRILREKGKDNLFIQGFLHNLYLRPCCYSCKFKSGQSGADLTLGDFWGIGLSRPELDDDKGVSLVVVNSEKGRLACESLAIDWVQVDYSVAAESNGALVRSPARPEEYTEFHKRFDGSNFKIIKELFPQRKADSFLMRLRHRIVLAVNSIKR